MREATYHSSENKQVENQPFTDNSVQQKEFRTPI